MVTWAYQDCDRPMWVSEKRDELARVLKERALEEEGKRQEVEAQLETKRDELEGAWAELATAQAEVACLKAKNSKS